MNKVLIVDASDSDCRLMSGLPTRTRYETIIAVFNLSFFLQFSCQLEGFKLSLHCQSV